MTETAVKAVPTGYHTVTPYLSVQNVAGLVDFLARAFGAQELHRTVHPNGTFAHCEVRLGDSIVMFSEASEAWPPTPTSIYLYVEDTDAAYRRALEAGATSLMEPADQFYGDRNAGIKDPAGNSWWIATHFEDVPPAELQKRFEAALAQRG
ncbi:VOC family protein [Gloeobacter kilaueensis]|uniref:Glyoxalase/bleomycin resistance protein/dioxygenase n=1 Tax=Gloeobacter kilaueensis (strain ATCC BAA-2537 / CCAP 1431/1 / ULC 316 / JS1) TaxID=1183438 RepID=U5QH35_GLOK1|nr:VOC family protein [Gloeobacter kilaueensis]AGY56955.1 glyoxalase/bleomycin resistance protein/dioxygenase [Gloeobacter kilaueensis JS1]